MLWTPKIVKALEKSSILHDGQKRKGSNAPYIIHPVGVMLILSEYTNNEDTLVASLLHDTIEDTEYTYEEMEKDFGESVKDIVRQVTIPIKGEWLEERMAYIDLLKDATEEGLMIAAADKIHNLSTIYSYYSDKKEQFSKEFDGNVEERMSVYSQVENTILERLENPIVDKVKEISEKYKQFLFD